MKKLLAVALALSVLTGCSSMPQNMNDLGKSVTNGAKSVGNYLVELDKQARESNGSTTTTKSGSSDRGYISLADCQNSEGKTKAQIEKLIGISLTIEKAATINSFSAVYNLAIKNMKNRYAPNTPAICSLSFEGNKPTSKVLVWSIIGN